MIVKSIKLNSFLTGNKFILFPIKQSNRIFSQKGGYICCLPGDIYLHIFVHRENLGVLSLVFEASFDVQVL